MQSPPRQRRIDDGSRRRSSISAQGRLRRIERPRSIEASSEPSSRIPSRPELSLTIVGGGYAANAPCSEANPTRCYIAGLFCGRSESGSGRPFRPETQALNDTPRQTDDTGNRPCKNKLEFNGPVRMSRYLSSIAHQKAARPVEPVKLKWIRPSKQSQRLTCGTIWRKSERFSAGFAPASR